MIKVTSELFSRGDPKAGIHHSSKQDLQPISIPESIEAIYDLVLNYISYCESPLCPNNLQLSVSEEWNAD